MRHMPSEAFHGREGHGAGRSARHDQHRRSGLGQCRPNQAITAQHTLTASVSRARQAGHSWSTIGTRLGITKQAAQQRFAAPTNARGPAISPRPHDKEVTDD